MQSMLINTEALESPLYNPPPDPKALMLQEIMETTPISADARSTPRRDPLVQPSEVETALQEHVQNFNNLSLFNPYAGVIVNPTQCLLDPIRDDLQGTVDYMNGRFSDNGTWLAYRDDFYHDYNGGTSDTNPGQGPGNGGMLEDLDTIEDHTDRLTNNLPSLAGLAQAALALDTIMNLLSNPCLGLDGFLGSIMDKGKAILNDIKSKISGMLADAKAWVDANIGPLIDKMKAAMAAAKAKIAELISKAKEEVMKFAKAMLAQIRQGLAELMSNLPKDPCLKALLGSVVTGAAAAVIGG